MPGPLPIAPDLEIPASDLRWSYARSGGPGGQHANRADTRVRLHFLLSRCEVLEPAVKRRLREAHPGWSTARGDLVLTGSSHRSRAQNIAEVEQRLAEAVRQALAPPAPRKKTRPSRAARQRRLRAKRERGALKKARQVPREPTD